MSAKSHFEFWQGRIDSEDGDLGKRWHQALSSDANDTELALVGFASDLGVIANKGRAGAKNGPNAIRTALANVAWHSDKRFYDYGNIEAKNSLATAQQHYADAICQCLQQQKYVIGFGGGHEIAWGSYQGLHAHLDQQAKQANIGIINFDAHFDLRKPSPDTSSGTPFYQIAKHCQQHALDFQYTCLGVAKTANTQALYSRANTLNVRYLSDTDFCVDGAKSILAEFLQSIDHLYLTVCLDVFNAGIAPGVSAPAALGIDLKKVVELIHWIGQSQSKLRFSWRLADIAEMNPAYDIDNRTAKLAARLVFEMHQAMIAQS
ncbi:MAG: formimidoylglutamase [Aliiglaciecola sp.]